MKRRELMLALCASAAATAVVPGAATADRPAASPIGHGFHARVVAKPGMGDALIDLLFQAPAFERDECLVFLIGRSKSDQDLIFVTEGWASEEAHRRFIETDVAKEYIAKFGPLVKESTSIDEIPVGGKAVLP